MDILLINSINIIPGNSQPQIGQLILRKILRQKYETEYINFDYLNEIKQLSYSDNMSDNINSFAEYIYSYNPKIVGFYTICDSFILTVKTAEKLKEKMPNVKIVFGGPHATLTARKCLEYFDFLDVIAIGESEKTVLPLMDALIENRSINNLVGIAYRNNNQVVINNNSTNLSDNELSDYTELDYSPYKIPKSTLLMLEAGRGCPFACKFCSTSKFFGRKYRVKPALKLIEEMKKFYKLHGVNKFSLQHDMFTANKVYIEEFCNRLIDENLDIYWGCSARIDCLDEEMINLMYKAKCCSIYIGIETGSQRMQKIENKNLDLSRAIELVKVIYNKNINITLSFIYGFPDETVDDFKDTLELVRKFLLLGVDNIQLHKYVPLPETEDIQLIRSKLYFDKDQAMGFSFLSKVMLLDTCADDYIMKMPELFTHYYTFDTDVRCNYGKIYILTSIIHMCCSMFKRTTKLLLLKYPLDELYYKYIDIINEIWNVTNDATIRQYSSNEFIIELRKKYVAKILCEEGLHTDSLEYKEVLNFELILNNAKQIAKQNSDDVVFEKENEFNFDVVEYIKSNKFVRKKTNIIFSIQSKKIKIKRVV